ncbi:mechanosensitive ion channel family protein [Shewanella loihica]|uniref:Small-conductance mechanosensitive channel n=1 Tax=Shewanella loihica (strain ATCC BAA-1088 / PV-4) TaxID=323850 RepID=A3QA18_SHELP|nr:MULTISPECIES: mechanosensitive ion channel family protein [Shewanella]ABO22316.1 MscS Mechanosensitive ion channel [Shewanella loihica PV-4]QYJ94241.1 mechanosensitive ion channel family protein [Shewanella spartinae]
MLRNLALALVTMMALAHLPATADEALQTPQPLTELTQLQQTIDSDIAKLGNANGEMKQFIEYRIKEHANQLHDKFKLMMNQQPLDKANLLPLLQKHLAFIDKVADYYAADIDQFKQQLGSDNDTGVMYKLAMRDRQRDEILSAKYETLTWLDALGEDTQAIKTQLTAQLLKRSDMLNSLVHFTQDKLKLAVDEAAKAGKDVTAEQTALVTNLNERLSLTSASLSVAIELLDAMSQDTTALKQTLFSISGDITQDVLNVDVASNLLDQWWNQAKNQALDNGPGLLFKLFVFLLILFLAHLAGKAVQRIVKKMVSNSKLKFSKLLQDFFVSLSGKTVFALGLMIALSQLGFELGPLLAGFGVAGVIIGFALQDTLSNFASGMMILIYRPYDVGDLINAAGVTGKVSQMSLVSTTIKTLDNQRLIIPNNKIWGDTINNITVEHQRRVDMTFGIGYGDNIEKAEQVLRGIVDEHPKVLKQPEPTVKLHLLGESSVDFVVRPWVKPEDYWDVYWDITRAVKMRFDQEDISIPFPQRDVHIYQTGK